MIQADHSSRWYGQVIGVNDVTCTVGPGLTALLGPNGAGKSTLLKLATGQLRPTTGRILLHGHAPFANPRALRYLGYVPELEGGYDEMTGREFVTMLGAMAGMRNPGLRTAVSGSIETVGMTAAADKRIGGYSKGMRQRIKLAQALVHRPSTLILDEPLNGLDPVARRDISRLLQELAAQGVCVLVSSHILHEVEQMTQRILLMYRGRLLAQGDISAIRAQIDQHPHRITIVSPHSREIAIRLMELPFILSARLDNPRPATVDVETRAPELFYARFADLVLESEWQVTAFESPDNNLEAVFKYLVRE